MNHPARVAFWTFGCVALLAPIQRAQGQEAPTAWIEPDTGHRVVRLTGAEGGSSLYFHQNAYTETGDKLVISVKGGLAAVDLRTLGAQPCKAERIVEGVARSPVVGKKSRQVYYIQGGSVCATHLDTKATRTIVKLPPGYTGASGLALNADETLLASAANDPAAKKDTDKPPPAKKRFAPGNRSMLLFTVKVESGEIKKIHHAAAWLNHVQFSPTDPNLILFCHEGTWDLVDRIWTIGADGTGLKKMHTRTIDREIFGHEFFSADGKTVWYDLQTPRSTTFWLAGVNVATGERIRFPLEREQWSVHFNRSPDDRLFAGDGGGPKSVANRTLDGSPLKGPGNGTWLWLFTPKNDKLETVVVGGEQVKIGALKAEKLVDLKNHNYSLEPNVTFTPDGNWLVFRSNMHGSNHVYAVKVNKAK
jgi:oligogalacturonide lyase